MKIINVRNPEESVQVCKQLLYKLVLKNTVLFLSGGSTPKDLYQKLAKEKKINPGAVAMVDERYFSKSQMTNHKFQTNEEMIKNTQLLSYLQKSNTKFYPILENKNFEQTVKDYDETVRFLFNHFPKSVGILGIGTDGHTAGIPVGMTSAQFQMSNNTDLVTCFADFPGECKERITLTFSGLAKLDQIIVIAFGNDKKKALKLIFKPGSITEIPARFLSQEKIARKVTLITDQSV